MRHRSLSILVFFPLSAQKQKRIALVPIEVEVEKLVPGAVVFEEPAPVESPRAGVVSVGEPVGGLMGTSTGGLMGVSLGLSSPNESKPKTGKKIKKRSKRKRRPGAEPEEIPGRPPGRKLTTPETRVSGGRRRHEKEEEEARRRRERRKRSRVVR